MKKENSNFGEYKSSLAAWSLWPMLKNYTDIFFSHVLKTAVFVAQWDGFKIKIPVGIVKKRDVNRLM